ncbi:hypothetical protein DL765_010502 [Monosporascus sp. GIB2]|nr:hypothetical protein DL765_010502 [Monosporascus sp. GIB2]
MLSNSGFATRPMLDCLPDAGIAVSVERLRAQKTNWESVKLATPVSLDVTDEKTLDAAVTQHGISISMIL